MEPSLLDLFNDFIDSIAFHYPGGEWPPTLKKKYRRLAERILDIENPPSNT